ncbi:MAG TPA: zinc ribbon domain-containing protein, partial [Polyangium sp.]|nr:zinc ribbon domain-containing protein [Polyangium sp.]
MICDVCRRENADHLTFCLDCGRRLKPQNRGVPPTPPRGIERVDPSLPTSSALFASLDKVSLDSDSSPNSPIPPPRPSRPTTMASGSVHPGSSGRPGSVRQRPEAPSFKFSKSFSAEGPAICPACNATNPPGHRFCATCGAAIGRVSTAPRAREDWMGTPTAPPVEVTVITPPPPATAPPSNAVMESVVAQRSSP